MENRIWEAAFTAGAFFLAVCVAGADWKAYHTPGPQGAAEQTILFALSLGLTTGTAIRWSVPPWTGLGTALILMPMVVVCNVQVGDEHHLLICMLSILYVAITISSIKNSHAEFSKSVLAAQEIERLATCDKLTGLLNRLGFGRPFERRSSATASRNGPLSLLLIDLDRFKYVNDVHGHAAGDGLLVEVSRCLEQCARGSETISRLGGDEFAIILEGGEEEAERLAISIVLRLRQPFKVLGKVLEIGSSIGVFTSADATMDEMLSNADFALYRAKGNGRNCHVVFVSSMRREIEERRSLEAALGSALTRDEISVDYQPLVTSSSREFVGVEALARWERPGYGSVAPDVFIPLAEELGLITALGEWVLETACREVASWPASITLAVNISPGQFVQGDLPAAVFRILTKTGLPASRLELEVTEGILIDGNTSAKSDIEMLRSHGVRISLDDFGTGWSSIGYLKRFKFDKLKIDQSFVAACSTDAEAVGIIRGIIFLAEGLHLPVVAEGVETAEQASLLDSLRCTQMQGNLFGSPMCAQDARHLVQTRRASPRLTVIENVSRL